MGFFKSKKIALSHAIIKTTPMNETIDYNEALVSKKRPTLLTILCILTFLVSGYTLITGVIGIFSTKSFDQAQWEQISEQVAESIAGADENSARIVDEVLASASITVERGIYYATTLSLIAILIALVSAYGAYLMWNLRRSGFVFYTIAKIVGIIVPLVLLGFNVITMVVYGFATVIGVILIILYNVNRKYMV